MSGNPTFTIKVTVDTTTSTPTLKYHGTGPGGATTSAKIHKIFRGTDLTFTCPDGDLLIQFKGTKKPFSAPNNAVGVIVTAPVTTSTSVLTTKKTKWGPKVKYTAVVARSSGGPPFMVSEDPELEDGGGPGSGGPRKKKAAKKKSAKKKK